jgi:hypothetical protein
MMPKMTDTPGEKQSDPLTKPRREMYPPGAASGKLLARDLEQWKHDGGNTPSPGARGPGKTPQKSAVETMLLANQGGQTFEGEDR